MIVTILSFIVRACVSWFCYLSVCAVFFLTGGLSLCRVLLRVRMLYYLKQEVIGSQAQTVLDGVDSR